MNIDNILARQDTVLVEGNPNEAVQLLEESDVSTVVWVSNDVKFNQRTNTGVFAWTQSLPWEMCEYNGTKCLVISKILADLKSDVVEIVDPVEEPVAEEYTPGFSFFMNAEPPEDEEE
jgi:hypothetical protein